MGAQPKPRPGVASLARYDLPSRAAVMLTCAVCSLLRASCLFSRSHPPVFVSPSPFPFSTGFVHCDSCKGPCFGVGFHSNRLSLDPSVGIPSSLRDHSTGALSLRIPAKPRLRSLRSETDINNRSCEMAFFSSSPRWAKAG